MAFELTGDMCALLLVGVAHVLGHVQQSVRRMAKCTLKDFQEVCEAWSTSPNTRIWSFLERVILALLATALLYSLNIV